MFSVAGSSGDTTYGPFPCIFADVLAALAVWVLVMMVRGFGTLRFCAGSAFVSWEFRGALSAADMSQPESLILAQNERWRHA